MNARREDATVGAAAEAGGRVARLRLVGARGDRGDRDDAQQ